MFLAWIASPGPFGELVCSSVGARPQARQSPPEADATAESGYRRPTEEQTRGCVPMKFGIFDYIDRRDESLVKTFDERMRLVQAAEDAGFYGYHLTEHHATPLSMTPSPAVYLAALARETSRIRLGALLPLYHPLRLVEELCMVDALSNGRLDIGVGRGISTFEFAAYGVEFDEIQERFDEAFDVLHKGLTRDRLDHHGKLFRYANVPMVMRPVQRPHPPYWYGLRGDHGPAFAARHGMNGVTLGGNERIAKIIASFRDAWRTHAAERKAFGTPVATPLAGAVRAMFIADSDAEAERLARPAYKQWYDSLTWLWREHSTMPPIAISQDYDQARSVGTLVVGSPETVRRELVAQAKACGYDYLVLMLAFGSLTHAQETRSLALFRSEVMPALDDFEAPAMSA
jgi:alkanesulfonate monooxygenase SsuD/methylene tetrahydromethanopterin reductase-like flavin-dependent oxidoreductase (luciferase family)